MQRSFIRGTVAIMAGIVLCFALPLAGSAIAHAATPTPHYCASLPRPTAPVVSDPTPRALPYQADATLSIAPGDLWHVTGASDLEACTPGGRRLREVYVRETPSSPRSWAAYLPDRVMRGGHYVGLRYGAYGSLAYSVAFDRTNGDLINMGRATVVVRYWKG